MPTMPAYQTQPIKLAVDHEYPVETVRSWLLARLTASTADSRLSAIRSMLASGVDLSDPERVGKYLAACSPQNATRTRGALKTLRAVVPGVFVGDWRCLDVVRVSRGRSLDYDDEGFRAWLAAEGRRTPGTVHAMATDALYAIRRMEAHPDEPYAGLHPGYRQRLERAWDAYRRFLLASGAVVNVGGEVHAPLIDPTRRLLGLLGPRYRSGAHQGAGGVRLPGRAVLLSRLTWDHVEYMVDAAHVPTGIRVAAEVSSRVWRYDSRLGTYALMRSYEIHGARAVALLQEHHAWAAPRVPSDPLFPCAPGARASLMPGVISDVVAAEMDTTAAASDAKEPKVPRARKPLPDVEPVQASRASPIVDPSLPPEEQDAALLAIISQRAPPPFDWLDDPDTGDVLRVVKAHDLDP